MDDTKHTSPRARPSARRWISALWRLLGSAALLGALLALALWFALPVLGRYPEEVSRWIGRGIGQEVSIAAVEARWEGLSPRLTLHEMTLLDSRPEHRGRALARFESLDLLVDPWASIRSASFRPAALTVHGASLMVIRHADGSLEMQGIGNDAGASGGAEALARLFLGRAQVSLRSGHLLWVDRSGAGAMLSIRDVDLRLYGTGERHQITLSGVIEEPGSGRFAVEVDVEGDLLTPQWSGEVRLDARDLDLGMAARISGIGAERAVEGVAALELAGSWRAGGMESARGRFRLRDAGFESAAGRLLLPQAEGSIAVEQGRGTLDMESGALEWIWPEVFASRLPLTAFSGRVEWQRGDAGATRVRVHDLSFESPHLAGALEGGLDWSPGAPDPVLGLRLELERGDLAHLPTYLPVGVLPPGLGAWLAQAVHGGRIEEGDLHVEGALRDWPFDRGGGRVSARARVSGVELRYAREWPSIQGLAAELRIDGRHAAFDLSGGRVQGATLTRARVEIPHIGTRGSALRIEGELSGSTEQAAAFVLNSPLAPRFRPVLDALDARGPADLALRVDLPLPAGERRVSGRLAVRENRVDLPGLHEGLQSVQGIFSFEGARVEADGIEASYLDRPITLRVAPRGPEGEVRVEAEGTTTRRHLAAHLHNAGLVPASGTAGSSWLSRLSGEARWRGVLDLAGHPGEQETLASLHVASDLQGARLDLPEPLRKAAPDAVDLEVGIDFGRAGGRTLRARYGEILSAVFALREASSAARLARGALRLGGDRAELPDEQGLILGGSLPRLSLGKWLRLLGTRERADAGEPSAAATPSPLERLRRLNLQVEDLEVFGVALGTTRIDAQSDASSTWTASLVGANILGEVRIPPAPEAVVVHLDRLILPERDERGEEAAPPSSAPLDPAVLPAFRFTCAQCKLGARALGAVDIAARPDPLGTRIHSFYMRGEGYEAHGSGAWLVVDGVHESSVDAQMHSDDLGRLFDTFGQAGDESITGVTDMLLGASWRGSPFDFDLGRLDGILHFRASAGRLPQVRRGATGRLFGLLMLPSLPRRLALDFRDFFQEGLAFDLMEGSFSLESGNAYTDNFIIESPTATLELAGRTGLIAEDYDHVLTLTPKLSENIALLPIWLGERILNTRLFDRVFAHRYSIEGPWSAPRIEVIPSEAQPTGRQ